MRPGLRLLALLGFAAAAASVLPAAASDGSGAPACGAPGRPACPLQDWMRKHVAAPFALHHLTDLARALDEVARINPDPQHWRNWDKFARDGAARARAGKDPVLVCVNCHKVYRAEYNARFRRRRVEP